MKEDIISRFKYQLMKKVPMFYEFLRYTLGAVFVGKDVRNIVKKMPSGSLIINLGSGAKKIREDVKNVDLFPSKRVEKQKTAGILPIPVKVREIGEVPQITNHLFLLL